MPMEFVLQYVQPSTLIFLLISLTTFVLFSLVLQRKKLPYPPGPKGLPIIGNMLMMDQLTHRGLARLAKKFGGFCHLQMGAIHIVAISTPEMAREVLQTQDSVFSNRPANIAITYLTYDRADMAFANYGPFWRQMRKICVMKLFSRKRAESWASVREEVEAMIQTVASKAGSPINLGALIFSLTRSITFKAAFGSNLNKGQEEFMGILQEFSKLFGAFDIAEFIPWLGWFNGQDFNKRLASARKALDVFIDEIIDDHVTKKNNMKNKDIENEADVDMVDELMDFLDEGDSAAAEISQSGLKLTRDNIKALIMVSSTKYIFFSSYFYYFTKFIFPF
jgi:ferulate-5-hydroxylase